MDSNCRYVLDLAKNELAKEGLNVQGLPMPKNFIQSYLSIAVPNTDPRFEEALKFAYRITEPTIEEGGSKTTWKGLIVDVDENGNFTLRYKTELELGKSQSISSYIWGWGGKK